MLRWGLPPSHGPRWDRSPPTAPPWLSHCPLGPGVPSAPPKAQLPGTEGRCRADPVPKPPVPSPSPSPPCVSPGKKGGARSGLGHNWWLPSPVPAQHRFTLPQVTWGFNFSLYSLGGWKTFFLPHLAPVPGPEPCPTPGAQPLPGLPTSP